MSINFRNLSEGDQIQMAENGDIENLQNIVVFDDSNNNQSNIENPESKEAELEILQRLNEAKKVGYDFLPEELFVYTFTFLSNKDLGTLASVSKTVRLSAYAPFLWSKLDLSSYSYGVYDGFLKHILNSSNRFSEITFLSIEGCNALTKKSLKEIKRRCSTRLETVLFTGCTRFDNESIIQFVKDLSSLKKIELYGCQIEGVLVDQLLAIRPNLDFGFLQYLYCAGRGIQLPPLQKPVPAIKQMDPLDTGNVDQIDFDNYRLPEQLAPTAGDQEVTPTQIDRIAESTIPADARVHSHSVEYERLSILEMKTPAPVNASCRYDEVFEGGGCWGRVRGRIIYGNQHYHRSGNYPKDITYACRAHQGLDFEQNEYNKCEICYRLFLDESCWNEILCKVCYDRDQLDDRKYWIRLKKQNIEDVSFSDLTSKTLELADQKNLPNSLKRIGTFRCDLDFSYVFDNSELTGDDDIPVKLFWEGNHARVDDHLDVLRDLLKKSKEEHRANRALLCYEGDKETVVYADRCIISDGLHGSGFLKITMDAWARIYALLLPLLIILLLVLFFLLYVSRKMIENDSTLSTIYVEELMPEPNNLIMIIVSVSVVVFFLVAVFLVQWFRDHCLPVLRYLFMYDIFLALSGGPFMILWFLFEQSNFEFEVITLLLAVLNFGAVGIVSFYEPSPKLLNQLYAGIFFNLIIASYLSWFLKYFVVIFVILYVIIDIWQHFIPNQIFIPFLISARDPIGLSTPKLFFSTGKIRVRSPDFYIYGMMIGIIILDFAVISISILTILSVFTICVFVLPLFSLNIRPLPVVFLVFIMFSVISGNLIFKKQISQGVYRWAFSSYQ